MRHLQHIGTLFFVVLLCLSSPVLCSDAEQVCDEQGVCTNKNPQIKTRKQIAVIGGGIAGSSAAYYLSQLIPDVDITIYEKNTGVCGRVQDTIINGNNVEVGGSIYHKSNANVDGFVHKFNLTKLTPFGGSTTGIWNGQEFVFRGWSTPVLGEIVNVAKMFLRYGWTPYNLKTYLGSLMGNWSNLYTMREPFHTIDEFFGRLGLQDEATSLAPEHLEKFGISREFTKEILGSMTRVNYNTDVSVMNAFGVAVSAIGSGDSVYGVGEGNKLICSNLADAAKASAKYGHKVLSITRKNIDDIGFFVETEVDKDSYDAVVIAVPLELANIELKNMDVDDFVFKAREFQEVFVTFVAGHLNPTYFGLDPDSTPPSFVLTVENSSIPFSSIGRSKNITMPDGSPVSKVFSRTKFTPELVNRIFINGSIIFQKPIHAYPILRPPTKFVPVELAKQVYYVNSMESVVSTIETETISAKNIARLLAKTWGYPYYKEV